MSGIKTWISFGISYQMANNVRNQNMDIFWYFIYSARQRMSHPNAIVTILLQNHHFKLYVIIHYLQWFTYEATPVLNFSETCHFAVMIEHYHKLQDARVYPVF